VLVTGAASGLGLAASAGFASLGASVHALARNDRRATDAVAQITELVPGADVHPHACDISTMSALRTFTERFNAEQPRLDVLVNNAGVMPGERRRSADGHELTFATHVLAPFALTAWLSGVLERSAPARVINVSSGGMYNQTLPESDFQSDESDYGPKQFYARTKREEVVITEEWAERLQDSGVVVHAMHPGWADTQGVRTAMPAFRAITRPIIRNSQDGADTIVWLGAAAEPLRCTGGFWHDRRMRPTHYVMGAGSETEASRRRLWDYCESLVAGVPAVGS
jgi:dehydrogenase/reductase SDR family protein 12